jgi:hypothetical protein
MRLSRRKREALAALKRMLEIDPEAAFDPDEPDLQPLAAMPEFKAMMAFPIFPSHIFLSTG